MLEAEDLTVGKRLPHIIKEMRELTQTDTSDHTA
jgi:hypothetical protein